VRETRGHAVVEGAMRSGSAAAPSFWNTLERVSWRDRSIFSISQAGLMNNLNDGVSWGLFPIYFAAAGASLVETAKLVALYPAVWALAQIGTGPLSDLWGRKWMIVIGMTIQAVALFVIGASRE